MSKNKNRPTLFLVSGITLLATMGISSLLPALPLLAEAFMIPLESTWRIIAAFALPGLICVPVAGVLADRLGRKRVLLISLALFALGGAGCSLAQTYLQLLTCRLVQGMGSASFGLLYATIIADTWHGKERLAVMSRNAMVLGLGTAASPALGGALAMLDWRLPFLLSLAALPLMALASNLPLLRPRTRTTLKTYLCACVSLARSRQTQMLLVLTLLTFIMLSGPLVTCFPLLTDLRFKASPLECGLILASASLAAGLAAAGLPPLYRRFRSRTLLYASVALYAIAFLSIAFAPTLLSLVPAVMLYGFAQGLNIPLVSTLLTGQAPDAQRAGLMAMNGILLRLGQNIGPAMFGTLAAVTGPGWAIACGAIPALLMGLVTSAAPLPADPRGGGSIGKSSL